MRALAHPLRLRILRLTLDEAHTNKELADRLGEDPGTVLHHVRTLVRHGFLRAEPVRTGKRGALERPYRSTGKSWRIRLAPSTDHTASVLEAVRGEVMEYGPEATITHLRLGVRLNGRDLARLKREIQALEAFAALNDPKGQPIGIHALVHRRKP